MVQAEFQLEQAIASDVEKCMQYILEQYDFKLQVKTNWPLNDQTYGEVGGRFIDSFFRTRLPEIVKQKASREGHLYHIVAAKKPSSRRAIEDVLLAWYNPQFDPEPHAIRLSLKGHYKGRASQPNLASLRKALAFYTDRNNLDEHIVVAYCPFTPIEIPESGFTMEFSKERPIQAFHLKNLSEKNMWLGDIGSGGQIMLSEIENICSTYRTRVEFVELMTAKATEWRNRLKNLRAKRGR